MNAVIFMLFVDILKDLNNFTVLNDNNIQKGAAKTCPSQRSF